jgi:hypothetical protein
MHSKLNSEMREIDKELKEVEFSGMTGGNKKRLREILLIST